ncbi:MAG: Flp pilus assembly complex ATPase component TadA [Planctomycetaceae bacterium]|nr:Flp pilus assembly complex ATPase component TadA [Planctomycetaceae bacterium]
MGALPRHQAFVDRLPRQQLGEALVARGLITPKQLVDALDHQKEKGHKRLLGETLVELGFVTEHDVMEVVADGYGIPFARDIARIADPRCIEVLPREYLLEHLVLPMFLVRGTLTVAVAEPANFYLVDELRTRTKHDVQIVATTAGEIRTALDAYVPAANVFVIDDIVGEIDEHSLSVVEGDVAEIDDLREVAGQSPVVKTVNWLLWTAVHEGASDIHVEPGDRRLRVRYRIDGRLFEKADPPWKMAAAISSRIKIMAGLDISERRLPQDGDIHVMLDGRPIDLRVSTMPGRFGEKVVVRVIDSRASLVPLERLGMTPSLLVRWKDVIDRPNGIALVTGPTGSGKSTTLYSVLASLNGTDRNISTVEDPVEATLQGVNQFQVNDKAGFGFASALRAMLRQDPDVIMVGEIRDGETAATAVQAALTGHLVFSTLHTNDAVSAVTRLVNIGIEPYLVAATVRGVLAQRLVRKICPHCREQFEPEAHMRAEMEAVTGPFAQLTRGAGCARCRGSGFAGRVGVFELLVPGESFTAAVARGASLQDLAAIARAAGHRTMRADGFEKVRDGVTAFEEVVLATAS